MATKRLSPQDFENAYLGRGDGGVEATSMSTSIVATARELGKEILKSPEAKLRDYYDAAWEEAFQGIPDEGNLADIKKFRDEKVAWAEIKTPYNKDKYNFDPLLPASDDMDSYMLPLPMAHPDAKGDSLMYMKRNPLCNLLVIRPCKITKKMAALFQIGGVYSVMNRDFMAGVERYSEQHFEHWVKVNEQKALLANHMTNGGFDLALESIVKRRNVKTFNELLSIFLADRGLSVFRPLDSALFGSNSSYDIRETIERASFYKLAALIHIANKFPESNPISEMQGWVKKIREAELYYRQIKFEDHR